MKNKQLCVKQKVVKIHAYKDFNLLTKKILQSCWQGLINFLIPSEEPQVRQRVTRQGDIYWEVYDPATGKYFTSGSEIEMRIWIEQLYR
ncbi:hypothetical protein [Scytonema sp. NUACC26]|uniref:hypothetical protein n=1 Tax=Scytonema sp. NUACC26 TaxID=3140176 RepID=UPI0034DC2E09